MYPRFPCRNAPGATRDDSRVNGHKAPLVAGGFLAASSDPEQHAAWAAQFPGCLWGVPTGRTSGVLVLDLDLDKPAARDWYAANRELFNGAPWVQTGSGGYHFIFSAPLGLRSGSAWNGVDGIDWRADGGYAIEWESWPAVDTLPPAPAWFVEACGDHAAPRQRELTPTIDLGRSTTSSRRRTCRSMTTAAVRTG